MFAKKSLGQHYLKSDRALSSIIEAAQIKVGDTVLEIGPGTGILTERLLQTGAKVVAVEKDDELFELLSKKFEKEIKNGQLKLIHDDILNAKLKIENYKLVANIPYNITGAIFKKFLETDAQPQMMVLLVQKEVAKRIVSTDKESILSISVKVYGRPKYVETVKAGSFVPMPQVDSAIIAIEDISKKFFASASWQIDEKRFFEMLKTGFQSKRKKLASNLSLILPKNRIEEAFRNLGLDINLRAEDLAVDNWQKLAKTLL